MKFSDLQLHPHIQATLQKINFSECTPIQEQAIPPVLAGKDLAGLAQTGTGKTAAFLLPLIDRVYCAIETEQKRMEPVAHAFPDWKKRQFVLVLVPTRELAEQVHKNAEMLLEGTGLTAISIYGGTSYETQTRGLQNGAEFVIATPGRLIDLFKEHQVDLRQVRAVVFDEADRMFDMGFKDDMKFILRRLPRERQFLVFSATMNFDVLNTAYEFGAEPVEVNISKDQAKAENVHDEIFHVGQEEKPAYLLSILKKHNPSQVIIFSNYKRNVERIAMFLSRNNFSAMGISSLLTQAQRARVMEQFKAENDRNILVATDLAARGLDILGVDMVMNFDLPDDPENYVHRIGRTGRAGQTGLAFSLVSDRDIDALGRIEQYLGHKVTTAWLDSEEVAKDFKQFPSEYEAERKQKSNSAPPKSSGGPRRSPPGPRSAHRDRQTGRHQNSEGRGPQRDGPPPAGNGENGRPQQHHNGAPRRPAQGQRDFNREGQRDGNRAPNGPRRDSPPPRSGQQHNRNNNRRPPVNAGPRRPQGPIPPRGPISAKPPPPASITQKVSSFLKRIFSSEK